MNEKIVWWQLMSGEFEWKSDIHTDDMSKAALAIHQDLDATNHYTLLNAKLWGKIIFVTKKPSSSSAN